MTLHCFGVSTPTGEALHRLADLTHVGYSRKPPSDSGWLHAADLNDPSSFHPFGFPDAPAIWISFAPIWLFAPFLDHLATHHPERLHGLNGVIACSSSSSITKRFAANNFDHNLVTSLISAENQLIATCHRLSVTCCILQPTLIYGDVGPYGDLNLSRLLRLMSRVPVLPLPKESGLRQPIHAYQLASVALLIANQIIQEGTLPNLSERIALGGDSTLTYREMLLALKDAQSSDHPARSCRFLSIPNRLFFLMAAPLLLRSPKAFEAVLRMGANLSGFTPVHQLLGSEPQPFPAMLHF
tara:strand:- start:3752 stop:4645 length:894 start_codon:yes stop_codon:yes gene_type:complete